jgi:drug/metabolite transporter (DMT)-like permease
MMVWQIAIAAVVLAAILRLRGRGGRLLPLGAADLRLYAAMAVLGMVLPQFTSYTAMAHLPAGVVSIVVSMVPLFTLPLALALGMERFRPSACWGWLGAAAVVLLTAARASLPGTAMAGFVLVAMLTPLCYALEGLCRRQRQPAGGRCRPSSAPR